MHYVNVNSEACGIHKMHSTIDIEHYVTDQYHSVVTLGAM